MLVVVGFDFVDLGIVVLFVIFVICMGVGVDEFFSWFVLLLLMGDLFGVCDSFILFVD